MCKENYTPQSNFFIMNENELSRIVFNDALKVHRNLGPGLLESSYEECLFYELQKNQGY
jgi:hypothetical protein